MGRLLILILIVVVIVLVWRAFGPGTWGGAGRGQLGSPERRQVPPRVKGPDDDEDFLWQLDKRRFEEQRRRQRESEREQRERGERDDDGADGR